MRWCRFSKMPENGFTVIPLIVLQTAEDAGSALTGEDS
jgi:hypothetical protein